MLSSERSGPRGAISRLTSASRLPLLRSGDRRQIAQQLEALIEELNRLADSARALGLDVSLYAGFGVQEVRVLVLDPG